MSGEVGTLDIEQPDSLIVYLKATGRIGDAERPTITVLTGGVSNRVVLVKRITGEAWVIKQALPKLRVAADWFSNPDRIRREALALQWLKELAPSGSVPAFVFEDPTHHVLAMEAVPDSHANWKQMLLSGKLHLRHVEQFGRLLGTIHRRASERRGEVEQVFGDYSFFESLRIEPYYTYSASQVQESSRFYQGLVAETRATRLTVVHGDYSPKNVLIYQDRLILLDHEAIHFGDPAFDIGFSITHFLSKGHHLRSLREEFAYAAKRYWETYLEALGPLDWTGSLEARAVRHTLGCLLARVGGRSPLEYLGAKERANQRLATLKLMAHAPSTIPDMISGFMAGLP